MMGFGRLSEVPWQLARSCAFDYCDGVQSAFTDAHLNDPADFWAQIMTSCITAISSRICASTASCRPGAGWEAPPGRGERQRHLRAHPRVGPPFAAHAVAYWCRGKIPAPIPAHANSSSWRIPAVATAAAAMPGKVSCSLKWPTLLRSQSQLPRIPERRFQKESHRASPLLRGFTQLGW